jgi:O-acetylserine/cysteine efflux transporter
MVDAPSSRARVAADVTLELDEGDDGGEDDISLFDASPSSPERDDCSLSETLEDWKAILLVAAASAAWGLTTVVARRTTSIPPLKMQALTSVVAAPALLAASFAFEGDVVARAMAATWMVWASVVWAALASTVGATALLFWLVQRREPGRVTPWFLLTPLVSCGIGIGLMGDTLTLQLVLGGGATLVGVALVALSERRAALRAATDRQIQT